MAHEKLLITCADSEARHYAIALAREFPNYRFHLLSNDGFKYRDISANLKIIHPSENLFYRIPGYSHLMTFGQRPGFRDMAIPLIFYRLGKPRIDVQCELMQEAYFETKKTVSPFADHLVSWKTFGLLTPQQAKRAPLGATIGVTTDFSRGRVDLAFADRFRRCIVDLAYAFPRHKILWRPHGSEFLEDGNQELVFPYLGLGRDNLIVQTFVQVMDQPIGAFLNEIDLLISTPSKALVVADRAGCPALAFGDQTLPSALYRMADGPWLTTAQDTIAATKQFYDGTPPKRMIWSFPQKFDRAGFTAVVEASGSAPTARSRESDILTALEIASWTNGYGKN